MHFGCCFLWRSATADGFSAWLDASLLCHVCLFVIHSIASADAHSVIMMLACLFALKAEQDDMLTVLFVGQVWCTTFCTKDQSTVIAE